MVEPLKIRSQIPTWVEAPDGVIDVVYTFLRNDHRLTKASDSSKISDSDVGRHVLKVIEHAVRYRLLAPLTEAVDQHLQGVAEEFELENGECPAENPGSWKGDLITEIYKSLRGDVTDMVGGDKLFKLATNGATSSDIARAIVDIPVLDEDRMLVALGIDEEMVMKLMAFARSPDVAVTAEGIGYTETPTVAFTNGEKGLSPSVEGEALLAEIIRDQLAEDGDIVEIDGALDQLLTAANREDFNAAADAFTDDEQTRARLFHYVGHIDMGEVTEIHDRILGLATAPRVDTPQPETAAPAPAPAADPQPRRRGQPPGSEAPATPLSDAARGLLVALIEHTSATEADIASAAGISRTQMNNYRHGKTVWHPTREQHDAVLKLVKEHLRAIQGAMVNYERRDALNASEDID